LITRSTSRRNGPWHQHWQRTVLVACLVAIVLVLDLAVTYWGLTARLPGANDFYVVWRATQAWLQEGMDPYGAETMHRIQLDLFGQSQLPEGHHYGFDGFAYPLYTVLPIMPLTWLPYAWAEAIWLTGLQVAVITLGFLALHLYDWRPAPALVALWVLWTIIFYPVTRAFFLGQLSLPVAACLALSLWAISKRRDGWAGIFLALTTIKPQMVLLTLPWLLWWTAWQRRWRLWWGLGGALGVLFLVSLSLMPDWPLRFIGGLRAYESYTSIGSPLRIVGGWLGQCAAPVVEVVGGLMLAGYVAFWVWRHRHAGGQAADWLTGLTLVITSVIASRTATTNQVVLLLPLAFALHRLPTRWRAAWATCILALLLVLPWVIFLATVQARQEQPITYVPLPFLFAAWYIAARRSMAGSESG
jgi:hypothetical protein